MEAMPHMAGMPPHMAAAAAAATATTASTAAYADVLTRHWRV